MTVCAILLAAGASSRMRGADKLLEPVRGAPLLRDRVDMLLASECFAEVFVVLPVDRPERDKALAGCRIKRVTNPLAAEGMASSISAGIAASPSNCTAALIMPADLPDLTSADIAQVVHTGASTPGKIIRASTDSGAPGSPVLFPRAYFDALQRLKGDESGRTIIKAHSDKVVLVPLEGDRARLDLDTPEAWAAWRANNA